jgi:hypothetical protein
MLNPGRGREPERIGSRKRSKGLLERSGTGKGYLNEIPPVQSDLRVCASGELKSEQNGPGPRMFSKSMETGNVLSKIESQGFREQKGFGPELI